MFTSIVPNTVQWEDCAIPCPYGAWDFYVAGTIFCISFPEQSADVSAFKNEVQLD